MALYYYGAMVLVLIFPQRLALYLHDIMIRTVHLRYVPGMWLSSTVQGYLALHQLQQAMSHGAMSLVQVLVMSLSQLLGMSESVPQAQQRNWRSMVRSRSLVVLHELVRSSHQMLQASRVGQHRVVELFLVDRRTISLVGSLRQHLELGRFLILELA
jgi:hypothetical protein